MRVVEAAWARSLLAFVRWYLEPGSTVHTDGWPSYRRLDERRYRHEADAAGERKAGEDLLPEMYRVAALFQRCWLGTHQCAIRTQHLDRCLKAVSFRFNRRKSRSRGLPFRRLAQHTAAAKSLPYNAIFGGILRDQQA